MDWCWKTRVTITFHALYGLNEQEIIPLLASFELKRRSLAKLLSSTYFTKQDQSPSILHHVFDIYGFYGSPRFGRNRLEHVNVVDLLQGWNKVRVSSKCRSLTISQCACQVTILVTNAVHSWPGLDFESCNVFGGLLITVNFLLACNMVAILMHRDSGYPVESCTWKSRSLSL